jgi:hypothetical protein
MELPPRRRARLGGLVSDGAAQHERNWVCGASLAATVSHELFGTGDEKQCAHWAEIGDTSAPFSEWHEMSPFETFDACEEAQGKLFTAARPGAPENSAQCFASDDPRLKAGAR